MIFLTEADSFKVVNVRQLKNNELKIIKDFKEFLSIVYSYYSEEQTVKTYKNFKKNVSKFYKYGFSGRLQKMIAEMDKEFDKINKAMLGKKQAKSGFSKKLDSAIKAFTSGSIDAGHKAAKSLQSQINIIIKANNKDDIVFSKQKNPFKIDDPLFFQSTNMIRSFNKDDLETLSLINFSKFKYTYLEFPKEKLDDFQFIIYFIQNLKSSNEQIAISHEQYNRWTDFLYQDQDYDEFKKIVETYLYDNNKSLVPKILKQLEKYPELKKTNEQLKKKIKKAFRGIGFRERTDLDKEMIFKDEKKRKFVATSLTKRVAIRFAEEKGHLDRDRKSKIGIIIEYGTNPRSIVLDTRIFGSVYGESEILIDVAKSKINNWEII